MNRVALRIVPLVLLLIGAVWSGQSLADDVANALRLKAPPDVLSTPVDPQQFMLGLDLVPPRPVVALTVEDAVAKELLLQSRTLSQVDALRTAQALCEEARRLDYDPLLFLALIKIESGFDHFAVSPVGAEGLMQIMPTTGAWFAEEQGLARPDGHTFDPVLNVRLGTRYLAKLHKQFKSIDVALTAYNRGPTNTRSILNRFGRLPDSVRDFYAGKVLDKYRVLRAQYGELPLG